MGPETPEKRQEIDFLLTCLVDSDGAESRQVVLERLLPLLPPGVHPARYIESVSDPAARMALREKYQRFLNEIKLRHDLKRLIDNREIDGGGDVDLEQGAFLIARLSEDAELDPHEFRKSLDALALPLRGMLNAVPDNEHAERLEVFRKYLFEELGFRGNTENYYDPENSYLTHVLQFRQGIPVSLSVLCLLLARRVGLPLSGVNLPGHFILKYQASGYVMYMDAFNEGNLLTESDCLNFLVRQGLEPSAAYLARASALTILKRMYRNLINYHSATGNVRVEKILRQHFSILENCSIRS